MRLCCTSKAAKRQEEAERQEDERLRALTANRPPAPGPSMAAFGRRHSASDALLQPPAVTQQHCSDLQRTQAAIEPDAAGSCRVCWGEAELSDPLIRPCKCKGSIELIHASCLASWTSSSGRIRCEICGATLMTRSQAVSHFTTRAMRSLARGLSFCLFILLASNLPGFLGFFLYQLALPFRLQQPIKLPSVEVASALFPLGPNARLYIPCNVLGDFLVLLADGYVRARRQQPPAPTLLFAKTVLKCMMRRTVTRTIREALRHSQRKGWCIILIALFCTMMPALLARVMMSLPALGYIASHVYVYGYWAEVGALYWTWMRIRN